ncbi:MAG TPA: CoA-transferase subunit beta [Longimicrobiales bacterium]|nr:CoA-transferase subunit beta [Longimicrobiales bacterium]
MTALPTPEEVMTVVAARALRNGQWCFVGIGLPNVAANLARRLHAPDLVLVYESGTIDSRPDVLPLSIGDGELAETARVVVSVPEIFAYWLQAGRMDVGFLGAAQIDRFANLNTTVIGSYASPRVRLPGGGGAPDIAANAREVIVMARHSTRMFVESLDFRTSVGHAEGGDSRQRLGLPGRGPTRVITDLGVLEPDPVTHELVLSAVHTGVDVSHVVQSTGWPLRVAEPPAITPAVEPLELETLRELLRRSAESHASRSR